VDDQWLWVTAGHAIDHDPNSLCEIVCKGYTIRVNMASFVNDYGWWEFPPPSMCNLLPLLPLTVLLTPSAFVLGFMWTIRLTAAWGFLQALSPPHKASFRHLCPYRGIWTGAVGAKK